MSIVEPERHSIKRFLTVVCPCGRSLRAPVEMAGQEISCWECHRSVRVPVPHSPERAYRILGESLPEVYEPRTLSALFAGCVVLIGVLCVPGTGVLLGTFVLFLGALAYGELIRQCGIDVWDFDDWKQPRLLIQRVGAAALFALALTTPMLLAPGGLGHPPRFTTRVLILEIVAALVLPLLMFLAFARDEDGPLGRRRAMGLLLSYPVAGFFPLLLIPLGVVASELIVIAITSWTGIFKFLVLEMYPRSDYYSEQYNILKYFNFTNDVFPDSRFYHLYLRRLHQGYTYTATLPATLSGKTNVMASPWTLELTDMDFLRIRAMYCILPTSIIVFFLALQSRWLGAISTLDSKRVLERNV
jgi:hypothetical protein